MKSVPFGNTGFDIPQLVFGATSLGNLFRAISDAEKANIVQAWVESRDGPIVIDSAGKYGAGMSLEVIGRELSRLGIDASDVLISNKLGWRRVPMSGDKQSFEPDAWIDLKHDAIQDISRDGILRCWEEGNVLLGDYRAQLVSVHDPDEYLAGATSSAERVKRTKDLVEAYSALMELKASGAVTAVGIGSKTWETVDQLMSDCPFDWVMLANSFTIMKHPFELLQFLGRLQEKQIGVVNSALFHGGFLLGGELFDYRRTDKNDAADRSRLDDREHFMKICRDHSVSPFQAGLRFGLAHPAVHAVALSTSRAARVVDQIAALEQTVPAEFWAEMKRHGLLANYIDFV